MNNTRPIRRDEFLETMNCIVPWADLCGVIEQHYPKRGKVIILSDVQITALERKHEDDVARCEIETAHPGYLGAQDTFYVGNLKGVGRIYQQTFIETYSKVVHCNCIQLKHRLPQLTC